MKEGSLYVHTTGGVATVEFYHPEGNSLPENLLDRLSGAFTSLGEDPKVKSIILKSEKERAFCGGASLSELVSVKSEEESIAFFKGFGNVVSSMIKCPKPIIGRVQGKAVGGAVGLIAACDIALATEAASIRLSELSIGIGPFVVEPVIRHKIGVAATAQMSLQPTQWFNAYWAKEKGLFARVFDNTAELDKEVEILASLWAGYSEKALINIKKILWEGLEDYPTQMEKRARISGSLLLNKTAQQALKKYK